MTEKSLQDSLKLEKERLKIAFIPIICSAPLIYAHSHGFFEKTGLSVKLIRSPGWSGIKELLVHNHVDAAHMLSPMPLACALGIDGKKADIRLTTVQNINGQALTLANKHLGIKDVGDMKGFTFGVPYRFSMHYYLLCYFLAANGINPLKDVTIKEVAPPTMPFFLKRGWVDGVFAPEPFNQIPVYRGLAFIYILSKDIWPGHPCCSFATSQDFIDRHPNTYQAMLKSILEAELALHKANVEERKAIAREISDPIHLNQEDPIPVEQALAGDFPDGKGGKHKIPDRIDFIPHPWQEYGTWMCSQMQRWAQLPGKIDYREVVESVFETKQTIEFAEALGFARQDRPSPKEIHPLTAKDAFTQMLNQPYSVFQEEPKSLTNIDLPETARDRLSEVIQHMAAATGGDLEKKIDITAEAEIGQLQRLFNEMVLNMQFMRDNLIEQNERLWAEVTERKRSEEALKTAHDGLEIRVEERTAELTRTNALLKQEIVERQLAEGALRRARDELELRVEERAVELVKTNDELRQEIEERKRIERELLEKQAALRAQNISTVRKSIELSDMKRELEDRNYDLELSRTELEKVMGALRKARDESELRVEERTRELAKANEQLQAEINERKRAEEERERLNRELMEKNKELEQIVYVTSHDLRSPLVNIEGFTKELHETFKEVRTLLNSESVSSELKDKLAAILHEDIPEAFRFILTGTSKMDSLLSGLLKLSRLGRVALNMESLDMNELMSNVVGAFEFQINEQGVTVQLDELPSCRGDETQINQVFSNLLGNALKYLDSNQAPIIRISGEEEEGQATYCVEDNGIGIAPEHQDNIFEIFHRHDPYAGAGEGLGLTIVRKILDRHAGKIWVQSELGKGSKFFVSMPTV